MNSFQLDEKLQEDCIRLGALPVSELLLMNNSLVPWFVLVPRVAVSEIYQLDEQQQAGLQQEVNELSVFVEQQFSIDKLNVAAIGNIVRQLHVHVVGRREDDYCWPGVVWGVAGGRPYPDVHVQRICAVLLEHFGAGKLNFKPAGE